MTRPVHLSRFASVLLTTLLVFMSLARATPASERIAGPVAAQILEVIDGDSLRIRAHIWPGQFVEVILRLRGIDTPELRASCPRERELALAARRIMSELLGKGPVTLVNIGGGKYFGRVLGDIRLADGGDLAARMLKLAPARPYRGRHRAGWCTETDGEETTNPEARDDRLASERFRNGTESATGHVAVQYRDGRDRRTR